MTSPEFIPRPYLIGYGRVSTRDQNPDSQLDALQAAGCDEIYIDRASGKLASRPEFDKALGRLRPGDTFVITRLSRAMRSLKHGAVRAVCGHRPEQVRRPGHRLGQCRGHLGLCLRPDALHSP